MGRTPGAAARRPRTRALSAWLLLAAATGFLAGSTALPAWALDVRVAAPGDTLSVGTGAGTDAGSGEQTNDGTGEAAGSRTDSPAVFAPGDTLVAAFQLNGVFAGNESLGDGIPATLVLVVDLWRERSGWWDSLVRSHAFSYQWKRDTWTGEVALRGIDGTASTLPDRESLRAVLERVHEIVLGLPRDFEPGRRYYVTVKALIKPMEVDDLQKVDSWLSGDVTSSGGGGFLGIPKALARIVVDVSGLGDQTVVGTSRTFLPRP